VDGSPAPHGQAAALLDSLARNHALLNSNRRLAWVVATRLFYTLKGFDRSR
jgi:prophage maintenance system killer protein